MSILLANPYFQKPTDPYFANVVALLHGIGPDEGASYIDEKGNTWTQSALQSLDTPGASPLRAWTAFGNAQLDTAQSLLGGSSSLLLDGTGDYVSHADHADFEPASGNFTIEACIRLSTLVPTGMAIMSKYTASGSARSWIFSLNPAGNTLQWTTSTNGTAVATLSGPFTWAANTWYQVAVARVGATWKLFVDGVEVGSGAATALANTSAPILIGAQNSSGVPDNLFSGWIKEIRFTKGVGRYSAGYTPDVAPFDLMADASYKSVMSLLHFEGADASTAIIDNVRRPINDTAQSLYGGCSIALPWGCSLVTSDSANFEFGSGNFTIEAAIRIRVFDGALANDILTKYTANVAGDREYIFAVTGAGTALQFAYDLDGGGIDETVSKAFAFSPDTWYQVAVARVGGTIYLFVDGTMIGSSSLIGGNAINAAASPVRIGQQNSGTSGNTGCYYGWVQEIRVTKGVGRYSANYTPPSSAFLNS